MEDKGREIQIRQVQKFLSEKLPVDWHTRLRWYVDSYDFTQLLDILYTEMLEGRRFTPAVRTLFRPFELCPLGKLQLIIVYPEPSLDPTVNNVSDELSTLAQSGVLLLNSSLTARIGQVARHGKIWRPFINALIDVLNRMDGLSWLFIGEIDWEEVVDNPSHTKIRMDNAPDLLITIKEKFPHLKL